MTASEAAGLLSQWDQILILTHQNPDGDTLGCAFALWNALENAGKRARVCCPDPLPARFSFLYEGYAEREFPVRHVVSVDVASLQLLGRLQETYGDRIDLAIDHHPSNAGFAAQTCLRAEAAAASEIIYDVIRALGGELTPQIATCLYTGVATDTGCFKFSNTTGNTHRVAADLFDAGADAAYINEFLFDTKSRARIEIERRALNTVEFFCGGRLAVMQVSQQMIRETCVDESELDGITAIPRQIEGVDIGVTIREKPDGSQKISVRTTAAADASQICLQFGGGGHARAAGCQMETDYAAAREKLVQACAKALG